LAKQLHPDVNKAPDAKEQFQALQYSYENGLDFSLETYIKTKFNTTKPKTKSKNSYKKDNFVWKYYVTTITLSESILGTQRSFGGVLLKINKGILDGESLFYERIGLCLRVEVKIPEEFTIIDNYLCIEPKLSIWKAKFGGKILIPTATGSHRELIIEPNTSFSDIYTIGEQGLFNAKENKRDPLLIKFVRTII